MKRLAPVIGLLLAACPCCRAQVDVSFPLQGYYRVGKYMPARVQSAGAAAALVLRADGAMTVSVAPGPAGVDATVPWLAADVVQSPRWELAGVGAGPVDSGLTPLGPDQVLVAMVSIDTVAATAAARKLYPGKHVVAVPLTGSPAMGGDPVAWEALDAAVFDDASHVFLAELMQLGVSVIVRSDARPDGRWAWQGGAGNWFVRLDPVGPRGIIDPDVYEPVAAWRPGWPAPLRRRAALLAAMFAIVALGAALWLRTWRAALAVVAASAIAAVGFAWWGSRQPMVCALNTGITVTGLGADQSDRWTYYRPLRRREVTVDWPMRRFAEKPVFASARHLRQADLLLHVAASGRPARITWNAKPGTTLAVVRRSFWPASYGYSKTLSPAAPSPAREFAATCYAAPGDTLEQDPTILVPGPDADFSAEWPTVTVRRPSR